MTELFLRDGKWLVLATTRNASSLSDLANPNLVVIPANVASSSDRDTIAQTVQKFCSRGLDCLINNAGYGLAGPLESLTEEQIRQQFEVNFFAPLFLTRDLLPSLRAAHGKVINISSVLGLVGMPLQSLYVASKFALEGLSESLSYELSVHGIQICLVEPGGFRTGFARNIQWADNGVDKNASSVYQDQIRGFRALLNKKLERPGSNPKKVADTVFELCNKDAVPLRMRVGADTQMLYYMRRSMPQKVSDLILHKVSKKMLEAR